MAKSTGNLVLVRDLLGEHPGAVLRMLLLHRRWDRAWEYDASELVAAAERVEELHAAAGRAGKAGPERQDEAGRDAVLAALVDDLDVPTAYSLAVEHGGRAARLLADVLKV
jgi:cysteinyl-tRNA synthetase